MYHGTFTKNQSIAVKSAIAKRPMLCTLNCHKFKNTKIICTLMLKL